MSKDNYPQPIKNTPSGLLLTAMPSHQMNSEQHRVNEYLQEQDKKLIAICNNTDFATNPKSLQEAGEICLHIANSHNILNQQFVSDKMNEAALKYFKKAMDLFGDAQYEEKAKCFNNIAKALYGLDNFDEARNNALSSIGECLNGDAYETLGRIHNVHCNFRAAVHDFERALSFPEYKAQSELMCLYHMTLSLAASGEAERALQKLEDANNRAYTEPLDQKDIIIIEQMRKPEYQNALKNLAETAAHESKKLHCSHSNHEDNEATEIETYNNNTEQQTRYSTPERHSPVYTEDQVHEMVDTITRDLVSRLNSQVSTLSESGITISDEKNAILHDPYKRGLYKEFKHDLLARFTASQVLSTDMVVNKPSEGAAFATKVFAVGKNIAPAPIAAGFQIAGAICKIVDDRRSSANTEKFTHLIDDPEEVNKFVDHLSMKLATSAKPRQAIEEPNNFYNNTIKIAGGYNTKPMSPELQGRMDAKDLVNKVVSIIYQNDITDLEIDEKITHIINLLKDPNFITYDGIEGHIHKTVTEILDIIKDIAKDNGYTWKHKESLETEFVQSIEIGLKNISRHYEEEAFATLLDKLKLPFAEICFSETSEVVSRGPRENWFGEKAKISPDFSSKIDSLLNNTIINLRETTDEGPISPTSSTPINTENEVGNQLPFFGEEATSLLGDDFTASDDGHHTDYGS